MTLRMRVFGVVAGAASLAVALAGPAVVPSARLTAAECWIGGIAGALCVAAALWPWKCVTCLGRGAVLDIGLDADGNVAAILARCGDCGGDGRGRRL